MADSAKPVRLVTDNAGAAPVLPHNIDAEAALLGALLIDNRLIDDVQRIVKTEHFFEPTHGRIFDMIVRLVVDRNMVANPVTLKPLLEKDEGLEALGGIGYLVKITESGVALIGARDFARQIYELALLRALIGVGREMVEKAVDTSEDVDPRQQIEDAEVELYKVAENDGEVGSTKSFATAASEAVKAAQRALNSGGHVSGFTTGFDSLNANFGGLHKSDLVILAARPGMGKSALASNIAFNAAQRYARDLEDGIDPEESMGAPAAFFSLEMSADQLATRILAEQSRIPSAKLRKGAISQEEFRNLARAAAELENLPLYIDDTPGLTIAALRTRARRLKRQKGIGIIIVDYLQLLQGSGRSNDNRVQEISEISRGLKTLAKELDVPVVALSQLSRAVEQREDKKPQLSDLRESGSIEQDADIVLFIYREDYYHNFAEPPMISEKSSPEDRDKRSAWELKNQEIAGQAQVIIAKQRHGATGTVTLHFEGEFTKFSDLAYEDRSSHY
ncbi:replicative DNA helicase [uncultured Parasphingopyxis sp.]|mgnify:CR=1 FL=1|uniref:replicative DNA helicase n=3 Tax=Parasphingopyxis TaxID=1234545 RepID=UPI002603E718|nr:replicative DNA helicase [uncultured Parasphingopyxis sp.]